MKSFCHALADPPSFQLERKDLFTQARELATGKKSIPSFLSGRREKFSDPGLGVLGKKRKALTVPSRMRGGNKKKSLPSRQLSRTLRFGGALAV